MIGNSIVTPIQALWSRFQVSVIEKRTDLHTVWLHPEELPDFVRQSPTAMRYLNLLGPLSWAQLPERNLVRNWGQPTISNAAFLAACLIKLEEGRDSIGDLLLYLREHPALIWLLGFPLSYTSQHLPFGFDPQASLPTERHMARMLRHIPNFTSQHLLTCSVQLLFEEFARQGSAVEPCISLDTKHILAWVKENNPKAYVENRFNKTQQPKGDPDCKLGCKRKHNKRPPQTEMRVTPTTNPLPVDTLQVGEFYWGYGSGIVVVKVQDKGEFVLAEMTQSFDHSDLSYFFPLMAKTEQILGYQPRFGPLLLSPSLKKVAINPKDADSIPRDYRYVLLVLPCHCCLLLQTILLV